MINIHGRKESVSSSIVVRFIVLYLETEASEQCFQWLCRRKSSPCRQHGASVTVEKEGVVEIFGWAFSSFPSKPKDFQNQFLMMGSAAFHHLPRMTCTFYFLQTIFDAGLSWNHQLDLFLSIIAT